MDPYVAMYLIANDPQVYNHLGIKDNENKGKSPMEDIKAPTMVDSNLFHQVDSILLQQLQVDDPTMGLYYFEDATRPTLFLESKNANPTTYTKKKMMYVFLKTTSF